MEFCPKVGFGVIALGGMVWKWGSAVEGKMSWVLTSTSIFSTADFVCARPFLASFKRASRSLGDSWSRVRFWSITLWCWKMYSMKL